MHSKLELLHSIILSKKICLIASLLIIVSINVAISNDTLYIKSSPNPHRITQELLISTHEVLIIEAGSTIEIADDISIIGMGSIIARGTEDNPIEIRPINRKWNRIRMLREADSLVLDHVHITNGSIYTLDCHTIYKNCVYTNSRDLEWNQSISSNHGGSLLIDNCSIEGNNTGEGFLCHNMSSPIIKNCRTSKTPDAIEFIQCTDGLISNNIITNATEDGIDLNACRGITITHNNISSISDKGIEIGHTAQGHSSQIIIENNHISQTYAGIHLMQKTEAVIKSNTITNNRQNILLTELGNKNSPSTVSFDQNIFDDNEKRIVTDSMSFYTSTDKEPERITKNDKASRKIKFLITIILVMIFIIYSLKYLKNKINDRT